MSPHLNAPDALADERAQEYILHALSQPRPHTALEAEVAEQHAARAAPGAPQHAVRMKRVRSVSRAMCAPTLD